MVSDRNTHSTPPLIFDGILIREEVRFCPKVPSSSLFANQKEAPHDEAWPIRKQGLERVRAIDLKTQPTYLHL